MEIAAPGTHWIRGWVGPDMEKRKFLTLAVLELVPSVVQPLASPYTDCAVAIARSWLLVWTNISCVRPGCFVSLQLRSSGMWRRVVWWIGASVSNENAFFMFHTSVLTAACTSDFTHCLWMLRPLRPLSVGSNPPNPKRWVQRALPKRRGLGPSHVA
jgi:hypothetical protein